MFIFNPPADSALAVSPANTQAETMQRGSPINLGVALTSGTLRVTLVRLRAGQVITNLTFASGGAAAVTPTAQWACLVRQSDLAVLAKSADQTTGAWAANAAKTFTGGGFPYTVLADGLYYVGLVVVAGTTPAVTGGGQVGVSAIAPTWAGNSTSGLTTPASLGATAAAVTANSGLYVALT